jgi:glycosyltransferase involved in cell wall biosynthesis
VNGWVVEDPSPKAYADAIVGLLANPALRSALGAAARRTVEDEYGWERMIDQVEATYRRVLARRSEAVRSVPGLIGGRECANRP